MTAAQRTLAVVSATVPQADCGYQGCDDLLGYIARRL